MARFEEGSNERAKRERERESEIDENKETLYERWRRSEREQEEKDVGPRNDRRARVVVQSGTRYKKRNGRVRGCCSEARGKRTRRIRNEAEE